MMSSPLFTTLSSFLMVESPRNIRLSSPSLVTLHLSSPSLVTLHLSSPSLVTLHLSSSFPCDTTSAKLLSCRITRLPFSSCTLRSLSLLQFLLIHGLLLFSPLIILDNLTTCQSLPLTRLPSFCCTLFFFHLDKKHH